MAEKQAIWEEKEKMCLAEPAKYEKMGHWDKKVAQPEQMQELKELIEKIYQEHYKQQ